MHVRGTRFARLMRLAARAGVSRRTQPPRAGSRTATPPAPDLGQRRCTATGPKKRWVAASTDGPSWAGFRSVAVVRDGWSRRVVGGTLPTHLRSELVLDALAMARQQRRPEGVIQHADQGPQSTSLACGQRCKAAGVRPSMGAVGDGFDTALCERCCATLEGALRARQRFSTQAAAKLAIFQSIAGWYNPYRLHAALGYESPLS